MAWIAPIAFVVVLLCFPRGMILVGKDVLFIGWAGVLGGLFVFGYQCFNWLKHNVWPPVPLQRGLWAIVGDDTPYWSMPSTGYLGLDEILAWALDLPFSACLIGVSFLIYIFGIYCMGMGLVRQQEREDEKRKRLSAPATPGSEG